MLEPGRATRFAGISRRAAITILCATFISILACLLASRSGKTQGPLTVKGIDDAVVLQNIVARVHGGENYYAAAGTELRENRYALRSVFNWREPLYAWFLALFPNLIVGRALLVVLALATIFCCVRFTVSSADALSVVICFWLVAGACFDSFTTWGVTTLEIWAGLLIALSIFAYSADRWAAGLGLALLGLFIRELIAPYVLLCIVMAAVNRRWRELITWTAGLIGFAIYYAIHASRAHASMSASDLTSRSWISLGGLHFILNTTSLQVMLRAAPLWVSAFYLPLAVIGLIGIRGRLGDRMTLTVAIYLLFYSIAGQPFNGYWGFLFCPLLALGCSLAPTALGDLLHAAATPSNQPDRSSVSL